MILLYTKSVRVQCRIMGSFKRKIIREQTKYYWVISKRNSKKLGGTGKVKTIEFYLGDSLDNLKYLSWYLWNNDMKLNECLDKLIIFRLNFFELRNKVIYQLLKENKLTLRKVNNSRVDIRKKIYQRFKRDTQYCLDCLVNNYQEFNLGIDQVIAYLESFNNYIDIANKYKSQDADFYSDYCGLADSYFDWAQSELNNLLTQVPKTQKEYAKNRIWRYCLSKCPLKQLNF